MIRERSKLPPGVWMAAAGVTAALLMLSSRYGFHRDELYFLAAGRRLDWGYVDQPPLVPLLARFSEMTLGTTPTAIRVIPALAMGTVAVLAALIARRFGGGRAAQVASAITAAGSGVALAVGHLLSTATLEFLFWGVATLILVLLLDGADPRWWLALGVTIGAGMLNKHLIVAFAISVLIGLAATKQRKLLQSPWPWIGVLTAGIIALPNLLWQSQNDWPQLEMAGALAQRSEGPAAFVVQQFGLLSIVLVVPAGIGLWNLLRSSAFERWRPIGVSFVVLFVGFLLTGGKAYYVAPMYTVLLASGAVWFERLPPSRRRWMMAVGIIGMAVGTLIALPLVPRSAVSRVDATGELGETVGWPEMVDQIEVVYLSIPAPGRDDVAILTGSYGQAGAIEILGAERGLPAPVSGHNNYWLWGPPHDHGSVIAVGPMMEALRLICDTPEQVGTISNPWLVENEELGNPILLCRHPTRQLSEVWDRLRHYN